MVAGLERFTDLDGLALNVKYITRTCWNTPIIIATKTNDASAIGMLSTIGRIVIAAVCNRCSTPTLSSSP